jgi:hypothetical protein
VRPSQSKVDLLRRTPGTTDICSISSFDRSLTHLFGPSLPEEIGIGEANWTMWA